MEHQIMYELKENFMGFYPKGRPIYLGIDLIFDTSFDSKLFIRTKEDWMKKFNLTEDLFASLVDIKVFEKNEYGIKVLQGYDSSYNGQVFTIVGLDSIAATGRIMDCIEESLIQKFKIKEYKK